MDAAGTDWQFHADEKTLQIPAAFAVSKGQSGLDSTPTTFTFDNVLDSHAN